jgi:phospholipid/cholesterol/gamma-HCH transport system substrate-binding protein
MNKESGSTWKLGMFVIIGLLLFVGTIYFIGKQKNLFGNTFRLQTTFKTVSGLKVGNNVRFSGINVGTVDGIELLTDTSVMVYLVMKKNVQKFIHTSARASIGSDGLMGDKVLTISTAGGENNVGIKTPVKDNDFILSKNPIEMEDVMLSVKSSVDNANIITQQLAAFSYKMNNNDGILSKLLSDKDYSNSIKNTLTNLQNSSGEFSKFTTKMNSGKGTLGKLMNDDKLSKALDTTMANLQKSTKGLSENMEAAKSSFLLRGAFRKQKKAAAAAAKKVEQQKKNDQKLLLRNSKDSVQ